MATKLEVNIQQILWFGDWCYYNVTKGKHVNINCSIYRSNSDIGDINLCKYRNRDARKERVLKKYTMLEIVWNMLCWVYNSWEIGMKNYSVKWVLKCLHADQKRFFSRNTKLIFQHFTNLVKTLFLEWLVTIFIVIRQQSTQWWYSGSLQLNKIQKLVRKVKVKHFGDKDVFWWHTKGKIKQLPQNITNLSF